MNIDFLHTAVHTLIVVICGIVSYVNGHRAGKRVSQEFIELRENLAYKKGERAGILWAGEELKRVWQK